MNTEWSIRPVQMEETAEVKRLVYTVAQSLMEPETSLEDYIAKWEKWDAFGDLDDVQKNYFDENGTFLIMLVGGQIVGTGAFHYFADGVCELRRVALLPEYRGQGMGYALLMELLRRARDMGYTKACLWTNRCKLKRAVAFYHQLGFTDMPRPDVTDEEELWMEIALA